MAAVWLDPDEVAERLSCCRKTAIRIMNEMPHTNIGGTTRHRVRVSEANLDAWMEARGSKTTRNASKANCSSGKRVPRRNEM